MNKATKLQWPDSSSKVGSLFALIYGPHLCLSEFQASIDTLRCVCQPTGRLRQTFVQAFDLILSYLILSTTNLQAVQNESCMHHLYA
ncbi:hypothetical protein T4D_1574 [Trichinella pseudospiralis]|uniref:Uncharacterized protein n=1 Tax=Trichinella pseudospiralis TaxID=6337 RepID=A0A0V1FVB6_TRIPS|nr:hypothetical protein T4D_1574 [Trichinella pseudospiralis]